MNGPIQIKRPDVTENARALATLMGVSITDAIANAIQDKLEVEKSNADLIREAKRERARQAIRELQSLPIIGPTLTDDDLYDEEGLPK